MNPETGLPNTPEDTQFWRIRESYGSSKYLYLELRERRAWTLFNWTIMEYSVKIDEEMIFNQAPARIREEAYEIIQRQKLKSSGGNPLIGDYPPKKLGN